MKPIDTSNVQDVNVQLEEKLKNERAEWNQKFQELAYRLRDVRQITEAQVEQLSYRQIILENMINYKVLAEKRQEEYDKCITARFREYTLGYDIKLNGAEKQQFVQVDLAAWKLQVRLLNLHIEWCQESIKMLDSTSYAIKNKIQITNDMML